MTSGEYAALRDWTRAYAAGRDDTDPTAPGADLGSDRFGRSTVLDESTRASLRADALQHLERLETTRVARAEAARYGGPTSRDYTGEIVDATARGTTIERRTVPRTWDELLATR